MYVQYDYLAFTLAESLVQCGALQPNVIVILIIIHEIRCVCINLSRTVFAVNRILNTLVDSSLTDGQE